VGVPAKVVPSPRKKELQERDAYFLEVLMNEAGGDPRKAMLMAGFPETMPSTSVTRRLRHEIVDTMVTHMAQKGPHVINELFRIINGEYDDDPKLNVKLRAIEMWLDRIGLVKTVKSQIKHEIERENPVTLLPPKKDY
jgi:hypothetical protein